MLLLEPDEIGAERVVAHDVADVGADLLRQHDVVEPDLQPAQGVGVGDVVERPVRQHREIARHVDEGAGHHIDPDAEHPLLDARHHGLPRADHGDHDVVMPAARRRAAGVSGSTVPNSTIEVPVKFEFTST